jgi:polar amino acid transport system permease protein
LSPPGWGGNLLRGLFNSILIAVGAFGIGILLGIGGAFGKLYGGPVLRDLIELYTTVMRAVPELVLILLLYFAGTDLINRLLELLGYQRIDINGLVAGICVLGIVQGAYSTEVIRGAILSIPQGQIEAARAYGMSAALMLRRITLPAMLPFAIPGLANLWLIATKDTALLAIVGFNELTQETRTAAGTTKAYFTFFIAAGVLYLALTLVSNVIIARIERWSRRGQPVGGH